MSLPRRKEDDIRTLKRKTTQTGGFPQHPLTPVAIDGIPKTLRGNEGDLAKAAFVSPEHARTHEPVVDPLPARRPSQIPFWI